MLENLLYHQALQIPEIFFPSLLNIFCVSEAILMNELPDVFQRTPSFDINVKMFVLKKQSALLDRPPYWLPIPNILYCIAFKTKAVCKLQEIYV